MKFAMYNHKIISTQLAKGHLRYKCPFCGKRMVYHNSTNHHSAYFSHVLTDNSFNNPGETSEHLAGKQQLYQFFKTKDNSVVIEKYLPKINQWPDLMVNNTVIEFQCSPISVQKLRQIIAGYTSLGIKSWWILGSPYQKRRLRPKYIAKFLNYSSRLGFFMLYWKISQKCLEIHYQQCECGSRIFYRTRRIFTYAELINFINYTRIKSRAITYSRWLGLVSHEIHVNQQRLFHGDLQIMRIQQMLGTRHNTIMGCPIICHLPVYTYPIFKKRYLLWRILILLLMNKYSDLQKIYQVANSKLVLPLSFCQINNYQSLYKRAFDKYVALLIQHHYLEVSPDHKKITRFKQPRWFNSYYDKIQYLKRHR
ncbi:competence protein CoiA [Acetilactobacillus jinshanensis]|uniref:C2H2-type domain-containing protein n=1 Tax=Acetilactobacillus jinshanensis TaxID=1720083 RepID=A0A4P6ZJN9_9LACO|nr:competence protein CoiA family protein [Acetilactobacillus jinshanensis]QBP17886.1 hypothetical protein ELX58_01690 [Acetilactobacillus jinshanensis]URL60748.1 hypothetical protein HGK75_01720 [uncultured bacterium]